MTAADALTAFRALAGVPILAALAADDRGLALAIFAAAALSDAVDGWLARRAGTAGERGALADPLADKALVLVTLAALAATGAAPLVLAVPVAAREILVTALRLARYRAHLHEPASPAAKAKTALEMCALAVLIAAPVDGAAVGTALLAAALALGVVTLPAYVIRHQRRLT